jgi:hypothetical protein
VPDPGELQFDRAEPTGGPAGSTCAACSRPISDTYFEVNGQVVCASCRNIVEDQWNRGGSTGRFAKSFGLGFLAMVGCSIAWYAVLKLTDSQWGILAVVVGLAVGAAVRKGSNGRGGWRYQALAIFLTYTAIVSSYVPFIIEGIRDGDAQVSDSTTATATSDSLLKVESEKVALTSPEAPSGGALVLGIVFLLGLLYATPFLAGLENAIGILIIGFALYEAWKLNKKAELRVTGPYQMEAGPAGGGQAAPA